MIRMQIQLSEDQAESLRKRADEAHVSMAETIRRALDRAIASNPGPRDARRRALAVSGRFCSGVSDISRRHDDHLADAFGA